MGSPRYSVFFYLILTILTIGCYGAVTLFPFQWRPPRRIDNHAVWLPEHGLAFEGVGIAQSRTSPDWLRSAIGTHALELFLDIRPAHRSQHDLARIFTLSQDLAHRNLTVAQAAQDLVVRLRFLGSHDNGKKIRVRRVFEHPVWTQIKIVIGAQRLEIGVNGEVRATKTLPPAALDNWDASYRVALGNEFTYDRPWFGQIRQALVRTDRTTVDYVRPGALDLPRYLYDFNEPPRLVPFERLALRDAVLNMIGFVPLHA